MTFHPVYIVHFVQRDRRDQFIHAWIYRLKKNCLAIFICHLLILR